MQILLQFHLTYTHKLSGGQTAVFMHESTTAATRDSIRHEQQNNQPASDCPWRQTFWPTLPAGSPHDQFLGPREAFRGTEIKTESHAV